MENYIWEQDLEDIDVTKIGMEEIFTLKIMKGRKFASQVLRRYHNYIGEQREKI